MLVAAAAAGDLLVQSGQIGAYPAILGFFSGMFGDVVGAPLLDILNGSDDKDLDEMLSQFEDALRQDDIRSDIAKLLHNQDVLSNTLGVALQYHEQQIVEKILAGVSYYGEFHSKQVINQLIHQVEYLNPEKRYLTRLIYELEGYEGALEYIGMSGVAQSSRFSEKRNRRSRIIDPAYTIISPSFSREAAVDSSQSESKRVSLQDIRDASNKHSIFALIGEPGAGKTTTLRRLALEAAWKRLGDSKSPIPLIRDLSTWKDNQELDRFLSEKWSLDLALPRALNDGSVALYLDGLNEMGDSASEKVEALKGLLEGPNSPRYAAIGCRRADYETFDLNINAILVEPLDDERIQKFANVYLGDLSADFLRILIPASASEKSHRRQLYSLCKNPFTLRALMLIYEAIPDGDIPRSQGFVFDTLAKVLWRRELERKTPGWLPFETAADSLSSFAYKMIDDGLSTTVPIEYALANMQSSLLAVAHKANLLAKDDQHVSFYHQTIREYFAAYYVVKHPDESMYDRLLEHVGDDNWRQIILMSCSLLNDKAEFFIDSFIEQLDRLVTQSQSLQRLLAWAQNQADSMIQAEGNAYSKSALRCWHLAKACYFASEIYVSEISVLEERITYAPYYARDSRSGQRNFERKMQNLNKRLNLARDKARSFKSAGSIAHTLCNELTLTSELSVNLAQESTKFLEQFDWDGLQRQNSFSAFFKGTHLLFECFQQMQPKSRPRIGDSLFLPNSMRQL